MNPEEIQIDAKTRYRAMVKEHGREKREGVVIVTGRGRTVDHVETNENGFSSIVKKDDNKAFCVRTVNPISGAQARCSEYIYPEDFLGIYDTPEQVAADEMERRKRDDYDKHSKISSRRYSYSQNLNSLKSILSDDEYASINARIEQMDEQTNQMEKEFIEKYGMTIKEETVRRHMAKRNR